MSVTYNIKKEGITDNVLIPGSEISGHILVKLIADKLKLREQDILVTNPITGQKLGELEIIKDKYSVNVERVMKNGDQSSSLPGIVTNQQLEEMASKGRFFMIKSSNQENIQKARDHSVWATTFANQDRLRSAFLYTQHVFLFFATNRSLEIKGVARMQSQPSKNPEKTFWTGVSNIRLGGNFDLKWLRKKPLTSIQIQKSAGAQVRDQIMRMSDGQELDAEVARKIICLFELPTEPYYEVKQQAPENKEKEKKILNVGEILGARDFPLGFTLPILQPLQVSPLAVESRQQKSQKKKKIKKDKKDKKKKEKKKKKRERSSSSSSEDSKSSSSSSSSSRSASSSRSSQSKSLKKKKIKKEHKEKRRSSKSQHKKKKSKDHSKKGKKSKKEKKQKEKKEKKKKE